MRAGDAHGAFGRNTACHPQARCPVHHVHPATRGLPQAGVQRHPDHAGGPKPLRSRTHHLHAYGLDEPERVRRHRSRRSHHRVVWRRVQHAACPPRKAVEGSPRGPRSHPPHGFCSAEHLRGKRRKAAVRLDLEASHRFPNGRRAHREHHRRPRHLHPPGTVPGKGPGHHLRGLFEGLPRKHGRRRRGRWRQRPPACACGR